MIAAMAMGVETIEQIASGNHDAMAQLYDQTSGLVYGMALRIVRERAVAEEVAMDVYLHVWRTARQYSAERGSVKAWLATMARAIDWLRSSQARLGRESSSIDEAPPLRADAAGMN
jgi:RNA polymerase sigma-70 factor (ECF subfamily)